MLFNETILIFGADSEIGICLTRYFIKRGFITKVFVKNVDFFIKKLDFDKTIPDYCKNSFKNNLIIRNFDVNKMTREEVIVAMARVSHVISFVKNLHFIKFITEGCRIHNIKRFVHQARIFNYSKNDFLTEKLLSIKIMRFFFRKETTINDSIINYLENECKDINWLVIRPSFFKKNRTYNINSEYEIVDTRKVFNKITFEEVAEFIYRILISYNYKTHSCPYTTYKQPYNNIF